jgi:quercetin dioxygenase-like cupin family protein
VESRIRGESAAPWTSPAPGVRVRALVEGDGTTLMLYHIAPGTKFAMHSHPFPELGLILSGAGIVLVNGDERSAVGGDSYYFPAMVEHGFLVPEGGEPVVMLDVSSAMGTNLPPSLEEAIRTMAIEQARSYGPKAQREVPALEAGPTVASPEPSKRSRTPRPSH